MKPVVLDALVSYLRTGCTPDPAAVPDSLRAAGFVECSETISGTCPNQFCDADIARITNRDETAGTLTVVCTGTDSHVETLPASELVHCSLQPEPTMQALCAHLGVTPTKKVEDHLPAYLRAVTANDVDICVITDPQREAATAERIVRDAVEHNRVVVLLSLQKTVDHIIAIIDQYAMAVVRPYPLAKLEDTATMERLTRSATIARDRELDMQELHDLEADDLIVKLSQNPGMVEEKLAHLITLRKTGGMSNTEIADSFEKVCRAAFIMLNAWLTPGEGGGDDKGENIADTTFELRRGHTRGFPESSESGYPPIFGVVDAKSGQTARLDSEEIINKHVRYLDRTNIPSLADNHIAHVVVAQQLSGAEDIRWYKRLKAGYKGEYTVVVLLVDVLYQLVSAFRSLLVKNEFGRAQANPLEVVRPFFDYRVFERELDPDVQHAMRSNPPTRNDLPEPYPDYQTALASCPELLVVTEEMMRQRLANALDDDVVARHHDDYFHA